jgi:hypothetical protein
MVGPLGCHVNKPILVSIPGLFGTGEPRYCRLVGVEPAGLWLEGDELASVTGDASDLPVGPVFVPFVQIAFLIAASSRSSPSARRQAEPLTRDKRRLADSTRRTKTSNKARDL